MTGGTDRGERPRPREPGGDGGPAVEIGRYAGHGLTLAATTALMAWGGHWLDGRLGSTPLFVLLGTFLGFGAGFYSMVRDLTRPGPEDRSGRPSTGEGSGGPFSGNGPDDRTSGEGSGGPSAGDGAGRPAPAERPEPPEERGGA